MGCQCANKEHENKSEIIKEIDEEARQNEENNNNFNSYSKEGIFGLDGLNQNENQEKPPSEKPDNENDNDFNENEMNNNLEKNIKYSDYPQKMLDLINQIRANPVSYADVIEECIQNITEEQDKFDETKTRIIYKKKVKVALNRGEIAFKDAAEELRNMEPLPPLELKNDICVPLP